MYRKEMKGRKVMDEKNIDKYELKRLRMPVSISSISTNNERTRQIIDPESLLLITVQEGMKISNGIGEKLKKHNIIDYSCLHGAPDQSALEQLFASSLLYKSELSDLDEVAADNATASLVCERGSEEFLKNINEAEYTIIKCGKGMYRVNPRILIDMYIFVMSELADLEYEWMESLISQAGGECQEMRIDGLGCNFGIVEL